MRAPKKNKKMLVRGNWKAVSIESIPMWFGLSAVLQNVKPQSWCWELAMRKETGITSEMNVTSRICALFQPLLAFMIALHKKHIKHHEISKSVPKRGLVASAR